MNLAFRTLFVLSFATSAAAQLMVAGDWSYTTTESGEAVIYTYNGSNSDVDLPGQLGGFPVTMISNNFIASSFYTNAIARQGVTNVTLPDTLRSIGQHAFRDFTSLQSIRIPKTVRVIGREAFRNSGLTNIIFEAGFEGVIGGNAFLGTGLASTPIPNTAMYLHLTTELPQQFAVDNSALAFNDSFVQALAANGQFVEAINDSLVQALAANEQLVEAVASRIAGAADKYGIASKSDLMKSRQSITLTVVSKAKVGRSIAVRAIATSKLPVTVISSDPEVLQITGARGQALSKGSVTLTAIQEGNANFLPATAVTKTVRVE